MCVQELLWGEGGPVLLVVGLVHISAHSAGSHRGHRLPLWPCLLQQLPPHVSSRPSTSEHSQFLTNIDGGLTERRFVRQTQSCVHSVTPDAKCGSSLTPARIPRYVRVFGVESAKGERCLLALTAGLPSCRWACCLTMMAQCSLPCSWQCGVSVASNLFSFFMSVCIPIVLTAHDYWCGAPLKKYYYFIIIHIIDLLLPSADI